MRDTSQNHSGSKSPFEPQSLDSRAPLSVVLPVITRGIDEQSAAYGVMRAAVTGDVAALKAALAQPNALPDFANSDGISPLMVAAARGNDAVVDVLAAHPLVNLARVDDRGWTALHFAAWLDHAGAAKILLDHHAPPLQQNHSGHTAFDKASGHSTEGVFWQDRNFARIMKRPAAQVEETVKPVPAPVPAALRPAPEEARLDASFMQQIKALTEEWHSNPQSDAQARFTTLVAGLPVPQFKILQKAIEKEQAGFDWRAFFIEAARLNNTSLMCHLQGQSLYQVDVLNRALGAAIEAGDNRDAAHHLLRWRAEATAVLDVKGVRSSMTLHRAAYILSRSGIFEEMMTFAGNSLPEKDILEYGRNAKMESMLKHLHAIMVKGSVTPAQKKRFEVQSVIADKTLVSLDVQAQRQQVKGMRSKPLREKFNMAVEQGQLTQVIAAYVESREDRFFRGVVDLDTRAGGGAVAVALLHERYEFARMLITDGHHLQHAPMWLRHKLDDKGTDKAKQFAADHLSGKLKLENISTVGRTRAADAIFYPMYGRGYYGI
ncbi:MAG: ankyrin repeat domain-containing protein [Micavibrio sp.]|nr:ankyrin repeat domain-containing protein [Micavibrio sp.]